MFNYHRHRAALPRDTLVREIAERSVSPTISQLSSDADRMSPAELRGYVRAHARQFVVEEAIQLVSNEWPAAALRDLVTSALEQTTHLIIRQLQTQLVVALPRPHVQLRIAA